MSRQAQRHLLRSPRLEQRHLLRQEAFTLIEVLVAVGVIALLATLIYAAMAGMNHARRNMVEVGDRYQQGRMAIDRMGRELSSAYMSGHRDFYQLAFAWQTGLIGKKSRPDRVDFTAFAHRRLMRNKHESDEAAISYFAARNPDSGALDLVRRSRKYLGPDMTTGGVIEVMAEDIDDLVLQYLDPVTNQWQQSWDSTQAAAQYGRLPQAVWITLVLRGGPTGPITFQEKVMIPMMLPLQFAQD